MPTPPSRGRALVAIDGALALIAVLLILQMWLLTAALESFLGGHLASALPAAVLSGLIFAACVGLFVFIERIDADERRQP